MSDQSQVAQVFIQESTRAFESMKKLEDQAFAQAADEHFYQILDEESNSLEVLIKHMHGNMLSLWVDFLTSDGERRRGSATGNLKAAVTRGRSLFLCGRKGGRCCLMPCTR